jgi:hypothetical protein
MPQVELKVKEDEIAQIKAEAMRVNKLREQTAKKIKQLEEQKGDVENERDGLRKVCKRLHRLGTCVSKVGAMEHAVS